MLIRKFMYVAAITVAGAMMAACSNNSSNNQKDDAQPGSVEAESVEIETEDSVINLEDDNLIRPGEKADEAIFLDFNATWCVPCKKFTPAFESTAKKFAGKAKFYSVDIDVNPETAKAFNVESVPTIIVLQKDGSIDRYVGIGDVLPAEKFEAIVEKAL